MANDCSAQFERFCKVVTAARVAHPWGSPSTMPSMTRATPTFWTDNPHLRLSARLTFAALIVVVSWLAWSPAPPPEATSGWDKLDHFAAFGSLSCMAALGWGWARWRAVAAALVAYGVLIEWVQSFIPSRTAELADLLADGVGIALGLFALRCLLHHLKPV